MKKTRIISAILILFSLSGCSNFEKTNPQLHDTGVSSVREYDDYKFWEVPNELSLYTNHTSTALPSDNTVFNDTGKNELPNNYKKEVKSLQNGIIAYFKDNYSVDVSSKLNKQKVKIFSSSDIGQSTTMGYVDVKNRSILNLNALLLSNEYSYLFDNTYVHESLHMLGIIDTNSEMLNEGITDAYADLILCSMGKNSYTTQNYFEARTLAYQIISVDTELPHLYFETQKFSLSKRINERLKNIPQSHENKDCPGNELADLTSILFSNNIGVLKCNTDPYWYAHDAQAIVYSYCRTFNPDQKKIDYLRNHYLVEDFEDDVNIDS